VVSAAANADIYLDTSVRRLFSMTGAPLLPPNMLLALLKWTEDTAHVLSIPLRTDSQDIWIFRSPVVSSPLAQHIVDVATDFPLGAPRCDNRLAFVFSELLNFTVVNPVFHIHGIEIQRTSRPPGVLYGMKGAAQGTGKNLLIAETLPF
jgi:hypothetical protein